MGLLTAIFKALSMLLRILEAVGGLSAVTRGLSAARGSDDARAARRNARSAAEAEAAGARDPEALRIALERERFAAERWRAEETLRIERLHQAAARRLGESRLTAWLAVAVWAVSALFALREGGAAALWVRVLLGLAWAALLGALACSLAANARVTREFAVRLEEGSERLTFSSTAATLARWWLMIGLSLIGASVLAMTGG